MNRPQKLVTFSLMIMVLLLFFTAPNTIAQQYIGPQVSATPLKFNGAEAYLYAETLAKEFPRKWSGSTDVAKAADWLTNVLTKLGLEVRSQEFPAVLGEHVTLRNVYGISRGRSQEMLIVLSNYDQAPTTFQAASDTTGAAGTVIELARIFAREEHRRTLLFLFVDGEEWGMLGARYFTEHFPERDKIVAALTVEDLAVGNIMGIALAPIGQFTGYAPLWLRKISADAAKMEGLAVSQPSGVDEFFERAVVISFTDQGPFLDHGVPTIELSSWGDQPALAREVYHRPSDTIEKLVPASLERYGRVAERVVRTLDETNTLPEESMNYLFLSGEAYIPGGILLALQILVFLPLFIATGFEVRNNRKIPYDVAAAGAPKISPAHIQLRNLVWIELESLSYVGAIVFGGLLVVYLLPELNIIGRYELYPPPPRHPTLYSPEASAFLLIAIGMLLVWVALPWLRADADMKVVPPNGSVSLMVNLMLLSMLAVAALVFNSFGAVTFLPLPAYLWVWVETSFKIWRRVVNGVLLVAGGAIFYLLVATYAAILELNGFQMAWYLVLGVASGQFNLASVVLSLAVLTVGVRLFQMTVIKRTRI